MLLKSQNPAPFNCLSQPKSYPSTHILTLDFSKIDTVTLREDP